MINGDNGTNGITWKNKLWGEVVVKGRDEEKEKSLKAKTLEELGIKRPTRKQTLKEMGIGR